MKAKPFKRAPVPVLTGARADQELPRAEVVALVASRVPRGSADDETTVRNRISSKLYTAVRRRKLRPLRNGNFQLNDVARWVRAEWPGAFTNLPFPGLVVEEDVQDHATVSDEVDDRILPASRERCHDLLQALYAQVDELRRELSVERARVAALAPKADNWDAWNASKGRKTRRR